jgi:uncharacterized OB-fold protein
VSDLPAPTPPVNDETAPFWAALGARRLELPFCDRCGHAIWYPRSWCPVCQHDAVTWTALSGRGVVYASTILRRAQGPWGAAAPFFSAFVALAEGPRVLTNVLTDDPESVAIGTRVEAVFTPVDEPEEGSPASHLLRFVPTG